MIQAVGLIGKPVTFSLGRLLVRRNPCSTLSRLDLATASISSACQPAIRDPLAHKAFSPMIKYGYSASNTTLTTSNRLYGVKLHTLMTRKSAIDSGSFASGQRPCLGPKFIGSSSSASYSTSSAQGDGKNKDNYSNGSSFRNSVLWCWSSRMTKLILCSFAFALVPSIAFNSNGDDKLESEFTSKRQLKVQRDSFDYDDSFDKTTPLDHSTSFTTGIQCKLLKLLPLRLISRIWGFINSIYLPAFLRVRVLTWYAEYFGCNLDEAQRDLMEYNNLGEFFRRALKPGVRVIDQTSEIVSPADGLVINFGKVENDRIEQVKGVNYSLRSFLGPLDWQPGERGYQCYNYTPLEYRNKLIQKNAGTSLYHCVIYLAPGDYHRFHSPTEWTPIFRRHFTGRLYPVRPAFMSWFENLFCINERVSYMGYWKHGFFSLTAVGATNVGTVKVYSDPTLQTNKYGHNVKMPRFDVFIPPNNQCVRGAPFGEFNLGSTIVLIFEAPNSLTPSVKPGQRIKYGESLFSVSGTKNHSTQSR